MANIPEVNFNKIPNKNAKFNQAEFYEENFEKVNEQIVPKINELDTKVSVEIPAQLADIEKANVKLTNILSNALLTSLSGWLSLASTSTVLNGVLTNKGTGSGNLVSVYSGARIANHKYYSRAKVKILNSDVVGLDILAGGQVAKTILSPMLNSEIYISGIATALNDGSASFMVRHSYTTSANALNKSIEVSEPISMDLTAIFGAGYEPTLSTMDNAINLVGFFSGNKTIAKSDFMGYDVRLKVIESPSITADHRYIRENALAMLKHSDTRNKTPKPMLVVSYDDGSVNDYTVALPVHETLGVPAEVNVNNRTLNTEGYLSTAQLLELQEKGWEVNSHGYNHMDFGLAHVKAVAPVGATSIRTERVSSFSYKFPFEAHLFYLDVSVHAGIKEEDITITGVGKDESNNDVFLLASPLKYDYVIDHCAIRLSDNQMKIEVDQSIEELRKMGLNVVHFAYPHNTCTPWSRHYISKRCSSARGGNALLDTYAENFILPTYNLPSKGDVIGQSDAIIDAFLDDIVIKNALGIAYEHTWGSWFTTAKLQYLLNGAISRGIEITTRSEALKHFGNIYELGDTGDTLNNGWIDDEPYIVVNKFGKLVATNHTSKEIVEHMNERYI